MKGLHLRRPSLRRATGAGTVAGAAYLLCQGIDRRLAPNEYDDLLLWGGLLARGRRAQRTLGLCVHASLSIGLAAAYDALLPSLPTGPGWLRGFLFVQAENALAYPAVPFINRIHPAVRGGQLPSLETWRYFWVEIVRHAAYGVVLGMVMPQVGESERQSDAILRRKESGS